MATAKMAAKATVAKFGFSRESLRLVLLTWVS